MSTTAIEPLESRIAPAGIVTITQKGADLRLLGDAEANTVAIEIDGVSAGFFKIAASDGTMLRLGDQTAASFDIPVGTKKNLVVDLGAGADDLSLKNIDLAGKVDIKGGQGNNAIQLNGIIEADGMFAYTGGEDADTITGDVMSFRAASVKFDVKGGTNLVEYTSNDCDFRVAGAFTAMGGSGNDTIKLSGGTARFGSLALKLGDGNNSSEFHHADIVIAGAVMANGFGGSDALELVATNRLTIQKTLTTSFGDGGGSVELAAGEMLSVRGKSSFGFSKSAPSPTETVSVRIGSNDVRLGPLTAFSGAEWFAESIVSVTGYMDGIGADPQTPAGNIRIGATTINGATEVVMNATGAITVSGNVSITAPDGGDVSITAATIDISGSLAGQLGAGGNSFELVGQSIEISRKLALTFGVGNATAEIGARGGTLTAASVSLTKTGEAAVETMDIVGSGRMEVTGEFSVVSAESTADADFTGTSFEVGKALTFTLGTGSDVINLSGETLSAGSISVMLGDGANQLSMDYGELELKPGRTLGILGRAGTDAVTLTAGTGVVPVLQVLLGESANSATILSHAGLRIGKLMHVSDSDPATGIDQLLLKGVVMKELNANLGSADSLLSVAGSRVGKLVATLGSGADVLRMDDNVVTGAVTVNTGAGPDTVRIERDAALTGESIFLERVIVTLADGDDVGLVADAGPETKATFRALFGFYGDAGADTFTPHPTNAVFALAPYLTGTP